MPNDDVLEPVNDELNVTPAPASDIESTPEPEPAEPSPEEMRSQLQTERAAREKAERDLSSLRGQVRSSRDFEDSMRGEIGGIYKYLNVLGTRLADDDEVAKTLASLASERSGEEQTRTLTREYERLSTELTDIVKDAEGKPLFESLEAAPELEETRRLWSIGKSGTDGGRTLSVNERIAILTQATAEATKQARIVELRQVRAQTQTEKAARDAERKRRREADGDLDLDLGPGAGSAGSGNIDNLSPAELMARGVKRLKAEGKRSVIFDT